MLVAAGDQISAKFGRINALALLEEECRCADKFPRGEPLRSGARGNQQHIDAILDRMAVEKFEEGLKSLAHQVGMRAENVVGKSFPIRKNAQAK